MYMHIGFLEFRERESCGSGTAHYTIVMRTVVYFISLLIHVYLSNMRKLTMTTTQQSIHWNSSALRVSEKKKQQNWTKQAGKANLYTFSKAMTKHLLFNTTHVDVHTKTYCCTYNGTMFTHMNGVHPWNSSCITINVIIVNSVQINFIETAQQQ